MVQKKHIIFVANSETFGLVELKNKQFLETKLENYTELAKKKRLPGPYEAFIEELASMEPSKDKVLEKHHIIPRHAGGSNENSNIIRLTISQHILAHWLRWKQYDSENDRIAYVFRVSSTEEIEELKRQLVMKNVEEYKAKGLFFYCPEFQSKQGKKGGKKGGASNTEAQFKARQKVGLKYGTVVGQNNQSEKLKEFLQQYSIWKFEGFKDQTGIFYPKKALTAQESKNLEKRNESSSNYSSGDGETVEVEMFVLVSPKKTFISIVEILFTFAPGSINLVQAKKGVMNKLVFNQRPQMYGWKIIDTLTRSEVEQGALTQLACSKELLLETFIPE